MKTGRCLLIFVLFILSALHPIQSAPLPLDVADIELMVRSGFSERDIASEIQTKKMREAVTPANRQRLLTLGASEALVQICETNQIDSASAQQVNEEARAKKERMDALRLEEAKRIAGELERAKAAQNISPFIKSWQKDLLSLQSGRLLPFKGLLANKKLIAVYYSAGYCQPCRRFTPNLVQAYKQMKAANDSFEVIFVSYDKDAPTMAQYMNESQMPWPALKHSEISPKHPLGRFTGAGIPCLVLLDGEGNVLSHSYKDGEYIGPQPVLKDLATRLGMNIAYN
jgi:thiol-disulfide isomerase/thioredoxin